MSPEGPARPLGGHRLRARLARPGRAGSRGVRAVNPEDLVVHLARFARALREHGIAVGLSDEVDAVAALTLVDVSDRAEVRRALLTALKIRPRDRAGFDELFATFWAAEEP